MDVALWNVFITFIPYEQPFTAVCADKTYFSSAPYSGKFGSGSCSFPADCFGSGWKLTGSSPLKVNQQPDPTPKKNRARIRPKVLYL